MTAPLPDGEDARLSALRDYHILDTAPEDIYDDLVRLAAFICGVPIAAVSLIDEHRQWFKAITGIDATETPRDVAFCAHAILQPTLMVVSDARADARFSENPLVTGEPSIRFYAGMPLVTESGHALGSLCVIDRVPKSLSPDQKAALRTLAHQVVGQMDLARRVGAQERAEAELRRSAARLVEAQRIGRIGDWELDVGARRFTWSAEVFRLMEFDPAEGEPPFEAVQARYHPQDRAERDRLFARALATGEPYQCDLRLVLPSGTPRWCHLVGQPVQDAAGRMAQVVGTAADITDRKTAEDALTRLADDHRLLLESTAEGIYGMDLEGRCTFINRAASALLGFTAAEAIGRDMHGLIHHTRADGSPYPKGDCPILRAFQLGLPCREELEVLWRRDGTSFPASYASHPMTNAEGVIGAVVTFRDITDRVAREQQVRDANLILEVQKAQLEAANADLAALATTDPLTGLLNHRAFQARLAEAADRLQGGGLAAVARLDLDSFRFFNDAYGHAVGDAVLRQVAARLRAACGPGDAVARFGGDEFTVLLPDLPPGTTPAAVEARLRTALGGLSYQPVGEAGALPITVSVGAALLPLDDAGRAEALRLADERLRRAKTGGDVETEADRVRGHAGRSLGGFSMLDALVTAVDNKDRYTRRHSEDVMAYSLMIARALGLDDAARDTISVAALLHDVGKIGVPDKILRKPGRLTDEEFGAIKQHPVMGAVMVGAVPGLEGTLDAVRHHHERWDGGGYPGGLRGEETPLMARLMAVADAYSAMTTDRPYRKGMDHDRALAVLRDGSGTQWDPECVGAFLSGTTGRREDVGNALKD